MLIGSIGRRGVAVAALAVLLLGAAAGSAAALRSIQPSPTRSSATGEVAIGPLTTCQVRLEKELASLIPKVTGARAGTVRATFVRCNAGTLRFLSETAWTLTYLSFSGTLPLITELQVKVEGMAFEISRVLGPPCLYRGDLRLAEPVASGVIRTLRILEGSVFPLFRGEAMCPLRLELTGSFTQETELGVRLI